MTTQQILERTEAQIVESRSLIVRLMVASGMDLDHFAPLQRYAIDGDGESFEACWQELTRLKGLRNG